MLTVITAVILIIIIAGASAYIFRAKKHNRGCIGCPYAKQCGGKCNGSINKKTK